MVGWRVVEKGERRAAKGSPVAAVVEVLCGFKWGGTLDIMFSLVSCSTSCSTTRMCGFKRGDTLAVFSPASCSASCSTSCSTSHYQNVWL